MNKIFKIMFLCCIPFLAACSSDDDMTDEKPVVAEEVVIGASMPDNKDTRVAIDDLRLLWQPGDELVVIGCDADNMMTGDKHVFRLLSGEGTVKAQFKGVLPTTPNFKVFYNCKKLNVDIANNSAAIDYSSIVQKEVNNANHMRDYLLLTSAGSIDKLTSGVVMNLENAFLRIDLKSCPNKLRRINSVKWNINNNNEVKTLGAISLTGVTNSFPAEHNYVYIPLEATGDVFKAGTDYSLVFEGDTNNAADNKQIRASVKGKFPREITIKPGRFDVTVTDGIPPVDEKTLHDWTVEEL